MRKHLLAGTLLIALFTNSIALAAPLPGTYTIQGTVRNEIDRTPLKDVSVFSETSDKQAVTNENGRYQLRIPSTDTHQKIRFEKAGYDYYYADFNIYGDTTLNVLLEPEGMDPDLTITNMSVDPGEFPAVTDPVSISVTIKNIGEETLNPARTPVKLTVYDQTNWGFEYELNDESQELGPGEEFTYESLLPYVQRGRKLRNNPHLFTATIDSENKIEENDETNNTSQTSIRFHNDQIIRIDNFFLSDETQSNQENPLVFSWSQPRLGDYGSSDIKYIATDIGESDPYGTVFYPEMMTETGATYSVGYMEEKYLGEVDRYWTTLKSPEEQTGTCSEEQTGIYRVKPGASCTFPAEDLFGPKSYIFILRSKVSDSNDYIYSNVMRVDFYAERPNTLTVGLSSENPGSATLPKGATAVPFLALDFTAGSEDIVLDGLTLHRTGVGSASDFTGVYLYRGEERLTSGNSVSTDTNEVEFNNLDIDITANETTTLTLKANISATATAGSQNAFELVSADKIETTATKIEFETTPLRGEYMTISSITGGTITIEASGTIPNPKVGQTQAKIAEFRLTAANEDLRVEQIGLAIKGTISAQSDLSNFTLYQSSTLLAEVEEVDRNDIARFVLPTPFGIKKGDNRIFYVYGDISAKADANDTIQVYMEDNTDLVAIGEVYGFGAQVNRTAYDGGASNEMSSSTIEGGQVTISFEGPGTSDVAINGKDIQFLKLTIATQTDIEIKQLSFTVQVATPNTSNAADNLWNSSSNVANFTDIKLKDTNTGSTMMGPKELTATSAVGTGDDISQTLTYTDSWTMSAGTSKQIVLTMDIANNSVLDGEEVRVTMKAVSTTAGIKDINSGKYITNIVPSSDIVGNAMRMKAASLTVGLASSPVSKTYVKGTTNVPSVGFTFSAGNASDIMVTDIVLQGIFDENGSTFSNTGADNSKNLKDTVPSVELYDGDGNKISSLAKNIESNGRATFSNLSWKIEAGNIEKLEVRVPQISTTAPQNNTNDRYAFDLYSVTAQNADDGSSLSSVSGIASGIGPNGGTGGINPTVIITVTSSGTLTIANADNVVTDSKAVAGSDEILIAKYKAMATNEGFTITKMNFNVDNLSAGSTNDVEYVYLKYKDKNRIEVTSSKVPLTGTTTKLANFQNLSLYVPQDDTTVEFSVYIDTNTIESGAALSGSRIRVNFDATDSTDEFEAVGQGSGNTFTDSITSSDADLSNNNSVALYKSLPTFTTNTTSSGCPTNATKPTNGTNNIYCFNITANANGPLDLYKAVLQVATTGITISSGSVKLYDYADQSTVLATASVSSGKATFTLSTPDTIAAGQKVTYLVKADLTIDSSAQVVTVSTKILDDTTFASNAAAASVSGNVVWSDRSASSHSTTTTDWTNGYKVSGLPTEQLTMSL